MAMHTDLNRDEVFLYTNYLSYLSFMNSYDFNF